MRKIVILNHYGITPDQPGATKHYDMAKNFSEKKEYNIEFWMCGYNHHLGKNHDNLRGAKIQVKEVRDNINIVRIKSTPYRQSSLARQINIVVFDIISAMKIIFSKNIEVVVISTPPISVFNVLAAKIKGIKIVADVEDLWPLFLIDMGMKNVVAIKYMSYFSNFLYKNSNAIAAVSKGMVDYVKKITPKDIPIWLAPLGVNIKEYENKDVRKKITGEKPWIDDFIIMYVGAHGKANNLSAVLRMVKYFNERKMNILNNGEKVSFVFIGDGDQKDNLKVLKEEYKLSNVFFEDAVPGNMVASYLEKADVCLTNLMKIESFKLVRPNKLFQYMMMEKPIISGIWGEASEVLETANAGEYIDFEEIENASEKISILINNEKLLKQYAEDGKNYIKKHGDRDIIFDEYYNRITNIE